MDSPSDLRFRILSENSVEMMWRRPRSRIQGYRIEVTSDTGWCSLNLQVLSCHACNITSVIKISLNLTGLSTYRNYLKVSVDTSLAPGASNDKKGKTL